MARILVVDDSLTSRGIALRLIGELHEVTVLGSGPEALARIAQGGIDLVLLDLLMPGMDGQTVLAELKKRGEGLPVVVMTADIQASTRERILALGAVGMVNKPLTREKLVAAIDSALGGSRLDA